MLEEDKIPNATISSSLEQVVYMKVESGTIAYSSLQKTLPVFNKALSEEKSILKRVDIGNGSIKIYLNKEALEKIQRDEIVEALKNFLKEYLGTPSIDAKSFKYDFVGNIKSLQYFRDKYDLITQIEPENFKDVLKRKKLI